MIFPRRSRTAGGKFYPRPLIPRLPHLFHPLPGRSPCPAPFRYPRPARADALPAPPMPPRPDFCPVPSCAVRSQTRSSRACPGSFIPHLPAALSPLHPRVTRSAAFPPAVRSPPFCTCAPHFPRSPRSPPHPPPHPPSPNFPSRTDKVPLAVLLRLPHRRGILISQEKA